MVRKGPEKARMLPHRAGSQRTLAHRRGGPGHGVKCRRALTENVAHSARCGFGQPDRTEEHTSSGSLRPSASVHCGRTSTFCLQLMEMELTEPETGRLDGGASQTSIRTYDLSESTVDWTGHPGMAINEGTVMALQTCGRN